MLDLFQSDFTFESALKTADTDCFAHLVFDDTACLASESMFAFHLL